MKPKRTHVIARTLLLSLAIVAATFTVLLASDLLTGEIIPKSYPGGIVPTAPELRAMTVRTRGNADFPSAPNLSAKALRGQLDAIADFAAEYGYNAVFFEAAPECDALYRSSVLPSSAYLTGEQGSFAFFDPLGYLVDECKERGIQVYAVVNPYAVASGGLAASSPAAKNPGWVKNGVLDPSEPGVQKLAGKVVSELTANYDIAGVVLSGVDSGVFDDVEDYASCVAKTAGHAHDSLKHKDSQRLGLVVSGGAVGGEAARDLFSAPLGSGDLDFVVPTFDGVSLDELPALLSGWQALCEAKGAAYYPLHGADDASAFSHGIDNSLWLERQSGAGGIVISNYSALDTESRTAAYTLFAAFSQKEPAGMPDLSYQKTLTIGRPAEPVTADPSWGTYYIMGTSDPAQPLLFEGRELERSSEGLWGVLVDVAYGSNTYTFTQGGISRTAAITRSYPSETTTISTIVKSSAYPASSEAVLAGQLLKLSCTAPGGGTVTAAVGGLTATLQPVAAVQNGVAVTYQATLDVSSLALSGQVKNIGPVTYRLNYAGLNSSQQTAGEVYVAGEGAVPVARMKTFIVPVNKNAADDGQYLTILKKDCVDYITENAGGGYYRLSSGGYVLKSAVDVDEGPATAQSAVASIAMAKAPKGEKLTIGGTARPAFTGSMDEDSVTVTFHHLEGFEKMNTSMLESTLCSSVESSISDDGAVTLTFHLNDGVRLSGWDVQFDGNDTVVYLRERPAFDRLSATPLSDVTVVLDPGHGGTDPGASGVAGDGGPWEKTLNLANAYAAQSRLEALGATVHVLHSDETMTLNERMELSQQFDADLFISCHHNSLGVTADSVGVSGIEVYYWNDQSQRLAELAGQSLAEDSGRRLRSVERSYYRVTMMTACPSILLESGFITNPAEYQQICDAFAMYRYGSAVADAVVQYFAS